ncbi:nucleotide-diphospho-sugar transferase [Mucor mucedo]|uniref:nucleotide-diphospho-sugar transferase n=1 Tax=Mucor mucedo TaxID=29922 RepID=UPI002220697C|nr:nucleotide-diphospho-sugar transferase [Mucor mucedo]KAI7873252.1 nucleotide-diphospho-sugar transferase [Mucor mucedo]
MFNRWTRTPAVIVSAVALVLIFYLLHKSNSVEPFDLNQLCGLKRPLPSRIKSKESQHVHYLFDTEDNSSQTDLRMEDHHWAEGDIRGAFYMVVENTQLQKARESIRSVQDRMANSTYPWIILNSQKFTPSFKNYVRMAASPTTRIYFGQIDLEAWSFPYWIDSDRADNAMKRMLHYHIDHANSQYFHQLQRYQSGLFIHHPLFDTVDYVWHVEPGTTFSCQMEDPFRRLSASGKKIGFALTYRENPASMFSLWPATLQFSRQYSPVIRPTDSTVMPWLINSNLEYNFCHISSAFQIVETAFIRSEAYQLYFNYLDFVGGFFYERWTASAVQTLATAMFLKRKEVLFLNEVGYAENRGEHCPFDYKLLQTCACDFQDTHDFSDNSCTVDLLRYISPGTIEEMANFARSKLAEQ